MHGGRNHLQKHVMSDSCNGECEVPTGTEAHGQEIQEKGTVLIILADIVR